MLTRRNLLKSAAVAGATVFFPWGRGKYASALVVQSTPAPLDSAILTKFTEQLPVPPVISARKPGTSVQIDVASSQHMFHANMPAPTPVWAYTSPSLATNYTVLGPTIEATRGVPIRLVARNKLDTNPMANWIDTTLDGAYASDATRPRLSLHLHGGNTEPDSDGHPELTFTPKDAYTYRYANDQEATTLWYHDHALGVTRLNVYNGIAGFYLLRDSNDTGLPGNPLGLPAGPYEIPLVIQDKLFDDDGGLNYPFGLGRIWAPEFFGDVATVNGKAWPNLAVDRGVYRFRILNGSNARFYNLSLSNRMPFYQIGSDGGLLSAPVMLQQLLIAPGERADVLIDFSKVPAGTAIVMQNSAGVPFPSTSTRFNPKRGALPEIMQFTVGADAGAHRTIPAVLKNTPIAPLPEPSVVRNLSLVEIMDDPQPFFALLNNLTWHAARTNGQMESPAVNTVEQWNLINTSGDAHPIHLHLVQFQVKERQAFEVSSYLKAVYPKLMPPAPGAMYMGGPWPVPSAEAYARSKPTAPAPNERGWKDTVIAYPGEITRILVPFGATAVGKGGVPAAGVPFGQSFRGEYVWHCHILDHEDNEMMLPYKVV